MGRPAIFFDRDRTLIAEAPSGLRSTAAHAPEHVLPLPGAVEAVRIARSAGYLVVVVTNQPGPAKGQYTRADVSATNAALLRRFAEAGASIDAVYACEHHEIGGPGGDPELIRACDCRKPRPGLLLRAARELDIDLRKSAILGDEERDMEAGRAAGVRCFHIGNGRWFIVDAVVQATNKQGEHAAVHRHE